MKQFDGALYVVEGRTRGWPIRPGFAQRLGNEQNASYDGVPRICTVLFMVQCA